MRLFIFRGPTYQQASKHAKKHFQKRQKNDVSFFYIFHIFPYLRFANYSSAVSSHVFIEPIEPIGPIGPKFVVILMPTFVVVAHSRRQRKAHIQRHIETLQDHVKILVSI